jgi:nucleotide-binding universal stress UspA family protein
LLHIIEKDAPQAIHKERHLTKPDEADAYLKEVARKAFSKKISVRTHVHTTEVKDVADSIVRHATEEFNPDLIVMCAHGKGGFRDVLFGNIAQQVLTSGKTPILLLRPEVTGACPFAIHRIFVPLDSESIHDNSLPFAQGLAAAYNADIYLLTVIPTYGSLSGEKAAVSSMLPATATAFLDIKEETGKEHLQIHLDELHNAGFKVTAEISRGDPAAVITETVKRVKADLVILSTHRKAGMEAFWARSVAPNVARCSKTPVLLLPAQG